MEHIILSRDGVTTLVARLDVLPPVGARVSPHRQIEELTAAIQREIERCDDMAWKRPMFRLSIEAVEGWE